VGNDTQVQRQDVLQRFGGDNLANDQHVRTHTEDDSVDGIGHSRRAFFNHHVQGMVNPYLEFLEGFNTRRLT